MQVSYKAAEGFFLLVPVLLSYAFKGKLNEIITAHVLYFRIACVISILIDLAISYRIKSRIELHNVKTKIKFSSDDYIVIPKTVARDEQKSENGKAQEEQELEEPEVEMTVHDYDMKVITSHISRVLSNAAIHLSLHIFMKNTQPLLMLIISPLKHLIVFPPYIEYVMGSSMLRPFSRNLIFGAEKRHVSKSTAAAEAAVSEIPEKELKVKKEE
ncbi:hypothetical protein NEMIN01_1744 [Nematocida minor]|uniref:uncharacterized protein n=1 Tax=Nematocida minor TaxID=1912983 RepID=UPI00221E4CCB|nr:uncharacterized protein NEMIN01_1744 [Nematocida minor]KAI5191926.1 hypothetical protein NEMIN01_1744 [Nematocida minor]